MNADMIWVFIGPAIAGMITMLICGAIAKSWLTKNAGYQPSRAAAFFLGPLITSFGPVRSYSEMRAKRGESTTVATVFWIATAAWGLGFIGFFAWMAAMTN